MSKKQKNQKKQSPAVHEPLKNKPVEKKFVPIPVGPVTEARATVSYVPELKNGVFFFELKVHWMEKGKEYTKVGLDCFPYERKLILVDSRSIPLDGYTARSWRTGSHKYRRLVKKGNGWFLGDLQILQEVSKDGDN